MTPTVKSTLDYLYGLTTKGIKPGLERVRSFLAEIGDPQKRFQSIHVAGTNGKGTICHILYSVLKEAGFRTGLYTSPHIKAFNERILINGKQVPDEFLCEFVLRNKPLFEKLDLTFFEITTALAYDYFANEGVEWVVAETGMGGRLDATNVLVPAVSIIGDISMDHQQYLGDTIEKIAFEKAGILKKGVPAVIGVANPEARKTVLRYADRPIDAFSSCRWEALEETAGGTRFSIDTGAWRAPELFLPCPGVHQLRNAVLALAALKEMPMSLEDKTIRDGLALVRVPARLELRRGNPQVLFDVAHNPAKAAALDAYLSRFFAGTRTVFVFGVMADKDYRGMIAVLDKPGRSFIMARPDLPRSAGTGALLEALPGAESAPSVAEGFARAREKAGRDGLAVVTGSFHTVAEVYD